MMNYYLLCLRNKDPKKIFAKLIADTSGLDWNHVEILRETSSLDIPDYSFGAVSPLSRKIPLESLLEHYNIVHKIPLHIKIPEQEADIILEKLLGKPYSILQLGIIIAKMYLTKYLSWLPFVKLNLDQALICTELAGDFMQDACHYTMPISTETLGLKETMDLAVANNI